MQIKRPFLRHFVIETSGESKDLNSIAWLHRKVKILVKSLGVTSIKRIYHKFSPQGISLVYILSASHAALHSWPEENYLHIDLVTCTKNIELSDVKSAINGCLIR